MTCHLIILNKRLDTLQLYQLQIYHLKEIYPILPMQKHWLLIFLGLIHLFFSIFRYGWINSNNCIRLSGTSERFEIVHLVLKELNHSFGEDDNQTLLSIFLGTSWSIFSLHFLSSSNAFLLNVIILVYIKVLNCV